MRRGAADSNTLISGLRDGRKPLTFLKLALDARFALFISDEILEQTLGVLRDKFKRASEELAGDTAPTSKLAPCALCRPSTCMSCPMMRTTIACLSAPSLVTASAWSPR
jgi:hypothetical protein